MLRFVRSETGLNNDILLPFKKYPWCMTRSEGKITRVMDFFVNKMGCESSIISRRTLLISLNVEKRIVPRCAVYQVLVSKGLITAPNIRVINLLVISEESFLDSYQASQRRSTRSI